MSTFLSQGYCAVISSGNCSVCPKNHCLKKPQGICISLLEIEVKSTDCVTNARPDRECKYLNLD